MPTKKRAASRAANKKSVPKTRAARAPATHSLHELVIITGMSGAGKLSALKTFEDLGYYAVDNLPVGLLLNFADLVRDSAEIERAALVVDIREGARLDKLPQLLESLRSSLKTTVLFLEAGDEALLRRYSETRRPHPLGRKNSVKASLRSERRRLQPVREVADLVVDTSRFNVHELRSLLTERFQSGERKQNALISCVSFGFRQGVPEDADLMFDVRFLPNPHFIPKFRPFTGRNPQVARYILSFPQTKEFIQRISELLVYLIPHYIREGKSYLTIAFGCTGGKHRSVLIAEEVKKRLAEAGYNVKVVHRDSPVGE
ncbi:MAG: RNase adapter RapZ [Candidatus Korobacteraceae bacterium]